MSGRILTDIAIANLKPRAKRYEVPDPGCRGLKVVVQPSGFKSFVVRYRNEAGRARKLTLSSGVTLAGARKLASDAMFAVASGRDPASEKQSVRQGARSKADDTVERLSAEYIEHAKRTTRPNSARATAGAFRNVILPTWGKRSVHDVRRRDLIDLLEQTAIDRPALANRTRATLSHFFHWLLDRDVIAASPCIGIKAPAKNTPRDRLLADDEVAKLWRAADDIGGNVGAYIKLLVLTGLRRSEAGLRWDEVDGDVLTIAAERMKGRRAHTLPLSAQAVNIIAAMPRIGEYVFGRVGHFSRIKRDIDARMGEVPPWVLHDIRRSVASGMAKIGVPVPVIEKILAHRSGTFRGIVGTYQRHSFLPEMTVAMQRWADHIEQLVGGEPAKVVKLKQR